jgi:membrane-associated phospholipid phosphatase
MLRWEWIALAYFSYLAAIAAVHPTFVRARRPAGAAGAIALTVLPLVAAWSGGWTSDLWHALVPVPVLLAGYWLSGCFFVRPMPRIEGWLHRIDDICMRRVGAWRWPNAARRWAGTYFELAYLLVYFIVPAGAIALIVAGHAEAVDRFWATVMLAAFASYGTLPWVQTRPPRVVDQLNERARHDESVLLRRLNLWVLGRASNQVNTVPSGHAATATAVALAVGAAMPEARAILLAISTSIVVATVVGRYHFVLDSVAGVLVGIGAWTLVTALGSG